MTLFDLLHSGKPCREPRTGWFSRLASIGAALCLLCGTSSEAAAMTEEEARAIIAPWYRLFNSAGTGRHGKIARRGPDPRLSILLWLPAERMLGPRHLDPRSLAVSHRQFRI